MDWSALGGLFQPATITSAGGIVLAIVLSILHFQSNGQSSKALRAHAEVLTELSKNVAVNTEVMRSLIPAQPRRSRSKAK